MLYIEDPSEYDEVCDYDFFVPQREWSKIHVHLWAEHFNRPLKLRNKKMMSAFDREYIKMKGLYVFLDKSQILGKTYNKFYIPNICGKICKTFLQKYASSKRYKKKIGNFNSKIPLPILRENTGNLPRLPLKTSKLDVRKQFSSDKKNKINSHPIYFEDEYNFDRDKAFSISKTNNLYIRKEIPRVYKNKTIPPNSVSNSVNKIDKTKVFTPKSILKEKDDHLLKEQFLVFVDKNKNFVSNNKDSEAIDEHIVDEELNTEELFISNNLKSSIKKSVRFNNTNLCSYEPSEVFVSDNLQNSIVSSETELLFDQLVQKNIQIENKIEENVASDGLESLFRNSSEESTLTTGIEDIVNKDLNQTFSHDNQDLEIVSTKTNSSSIDFILPTPEILEQNTNKFFQKPIYENTDRIDENEEGNIPVTINMVHHQDVIKKKVVEDSLNEYLVERNDLNVNGSSEYHINTTLKLNVSQLHEKKKSNMEIYNIIKESDISEPSNQITNETVDVIKGKEQENECLENVDVEYSSDSSGRVYEEDMYSQHYDNVCSFESPQKIDLNASVVEDSESGKNQNKYGESIIAEDTITDSSTNAIVFDSNDQSDSKEIHISSDVDIESQLPLGISENNKFVIEDVILPTQSVSSAGNEIVISDSEDVGNNEINFENNNLDDITRCNYLTPISHKESGSQLTEAPKKDKTKNTYDNSSLNNTVKTSRNEPIVKDDTDKDIDHSKRIDTKLKKRLCYLPSEPKTINLSKNTVSDRFLNQGDISLDSELLAVNLKSLSKYGFITCNINYKTDKGFQKDTQRLLKNQVELINNEIEEDYINADIEQSKLEDLMMKNKNESSPQTVATPNSDNVMLVSNSCGIKYSDDKLNNKELNIKHETNSLNEICIRTNHNLKDKTICEPNLKSSDEEFLKIQKIEKKELKKTLKKTLILQRKVKNFQDSGKYLGKNENIDNLNIIDQTSESKEKKVNDRSKKQCQIYSSSKIVVNNTLISHEKNSDMDYIEKSIPTADQENYVFVAEQNQQMFTNNQRTIHDIFHHLNEDKSIRKINQVEPTLYKNNDRHIKINMDNFKQQNSESYNEYQTVDNDFSAGESEWFKEVQRELINKSKYLHQEDEGSIMNPSVLTTEYLAGKNNKPFEMNNVRSEDDNVLKQLAKANNDQIRLDSEDNICKDDLFSSYEKDFQTLPQKNISNKLLSNITSDNQVIENNIQLVVNNKNSEDPDDFVITPEIDCQLSLKRKKRKVKHNTDVKNLSSSIKQNEESDAYCISTENVVDIVQPHLAKISEQENKKMHNQEISPLNSEVNRQSLQNNVESENNYFFIKRKKRNQKPLLMKSRPIISSKINVSESNIQNITNTTDNGSVEEFYEQSGLIKEKSKQKVNRRKDHNIIRTESLENIFGETNSTSLSNYENQRNKQQITLQSEPMVTFGYMDDIDILNRPDELFWANDSPDSLREETQREGQHTVERSDSFFTDINLNMKDINHHDDIFENTNSTILSRLNEVQKNKRPYALMSEDLVIEPNEQYMDNVKDIENNENILEKINSITLSNQGNQRKKQRRNIRSEPLVSDISRQSLEHIEDPDEHENLSGNTKPTILSKQKILRKKHRCFVRSEPMVTDISRQSLEHIEDPDEYENLFGNTNPTILSKQKILRKKHRSVVRSEPLVTDISRQSLEHIEDPDEHENLSGYTKPTILSKQEIQGKKHQNLLGSKPLVTDISRQSLELIEDPDEHENLSGNTKPTILSKQDIQGKKHQSLLGSKPLVTDISRQSLEHIEDPDEHENLSGNTKPTILSKQEIQGKKHQSLLGSKPLVTDISRQSLEHIEDPDEHENLSGNTNPTILSKQKIQRKKHQIFVRSEPMVNDISRQSLEHIEDPDEHENLSGNTKPTILSKQEIQGKKHQNLLGSKPLVTDISRQSLELIEDPDEHENLSGNTKPTILSKQEIQGKKHQSLLGSKPLVTDISRQSLEHIEDPDEHENLSGNTNPTILSKQKIQRKKHQSLLGSKPLVTDISRQSLEHIEDPDEHENLSGNTNPTILSKQKIQRKKHQIFVRSEPMVTDISRQSLEYNEDPDKHENLFGNTNPTILSKQKILRKKHQIFVRSEPMVTDISRQSLEHIEDPDEHENLFGNTNPTILSKQKILRKKHRNVVRSKPLVTDISRQSLEHIEDPDKHEHLFGNTNPTILSKQKIQRKKHQIFVRSEPMVTDISRQSLEHIEDPDEHENLFGNTNPTILSKQKILRKKHRNVVRSKPLVTDISRQSLEHIEDPDKHEKLFGNTNNTTSSKQKIQGKKHRSIVRSEPMNTDISRQSLEHIEDPHEHEKLFGNTNNTISSKQKSQGKKHRSIVRSEPMNIDISRQSLEHIEDPDEHEKLFGNTNNTISSKQKIQGKKHRSIVRSEPMNTDISRQSLEHIEDPDEHEKLFGNTNPTILSKQKIQGKKHRSIVRSEPMNTDISRQSLEHIEDPDEHEKLFGNTNNTISSKQKIQGKKHRSIVRSEPMNTDISRQSLEHIEDPDEHEKLFGNTNNTISSKQKIQGKKHRSIVRSEPMNIDISRQSLEHIEDPDEHEKLFGNTNNTISSKQKIQGKKHRSIVRSEPMNTDISRQSLEHIEDPDEHEKLFGNTNNTISSKQKIQGMKHRSVLRSEPLVTDISRQPLEHMEEPDDCHDLFGNENFATLTRQESQRMKYRHIIRSESLVTDVSRQSFKNNKYPDYDDFNSTVNPTISSRQESHNKKHPSIIRSESLVTDICSPSISNIDNMSDHNNFFMHIDGNSSDYRFLNMEDYFLNYRTIRNISQQNAHKSKNSLYSNRSSSHVVPINDTPQVLERQSLSTIIDSYSEKKSVNPVKPKIGSIKPTKIPTSGDTMESNRNSTLSPCQSSNKISTKSGHVYHNSPTISERWSSNIEPEEDLNTVNSVENQLQSLGVTDNEYDINLLSDEDLKDVTCSQKSSTPSSGNVSQDQRICDTLWSETISRSSSGDVFGFDIELPSYDDNPKENISISTLTTTEYNNITSDDSCISP